MRIYLAHESPDCRKMIESCMSKLGHRILLSTACSEQLMSTCRDCPPDIAIVSGSFQGSAKFSAVNRLASQKICPLVAVIEAADVSVCPYMINDDVLGILIDVSTAEAWRPALYLAKLRFEQSQRMEAKLTKLGKAVGRLDAEE